MWRICGSGQMLYDLVEIRGYAASDMGMCQTTLHLVVFLLFFPFLLSRKRVPSNKRSAWIFRATVLLRTSTRPRRPPPVFPEALGTRGCARRWPRSGWWICRSSWPPQQATCEGREGTPRLLIGIYWYHRAPESLLS